MHKVKLHRWNTNHGFDKGYWELIFTYSNLSEDKIKKIVSENLDVQLDFYMYETPFGNIFTSHIYLFDESRY